MKGLRKGGIFKERRKFCSVLDGGENNPYNRSQGKDTPRRREESYESIYCSPLLWLRRGRA